MININLPERFTIPNIQRMFNRLPVMSSGQKLRIDFGKRRDFLPSAMLLIGVKLNRYISQFSKNDIEVINHTHHSYAAHLGFFRLLGLNFGREINSDATTSNYIAIQQINISDWLIDLGYSGLSEHIDKKCRHLAEILCAEQESEIVDFVHYNVREIVRNVFEHARAAQMTLVAQYWPQLRKAEIAIHDDGIGMLATTSRNPHFELKNDLQAINAALMPGFSGSDRYKVGDHWDNSGYGLYMTSEISRMCGRFTLLSNSGGIDLKGDRKLEYEVSSPGTFISAEFKIEDSMKRAGYLSELAAHGEQIARKNMGNHAGKASSSSKGG